MISLQDKITGSVEYLKARADLSPQIAVILGSGLGDYADSVQGLRSFSTADIPSYPRPSVEGHRGNVLFARLAGKEVLLFQGRIHYYEVGDLDAVLFPLHVAHGFGVRSLIITNAAGGINRKFSPGDLMVIRDQINLTGLRLLLPPGVAGRPGSCYSERLTNLALSVASELSLPLKQGVYAGLQGPSYETAAEIEMIRRIGGDAVGMSTVAEASFASSLGMEVLGLSCITNNATGIAQKKLDHSEVTEVANRVKKNFGHLLTSIIGRM